MSAKELPENMGECTSCKVLVEGVPLHQGKLMEQILSSVAGGLGGHPPRNPKASANGEITRNS